MRAAMIDEENDDLYFELDYRHFYLILEIKAWLEEHCPSAKFKAGSTKTPITQRFNHMNGYSAVHGFNTEWYANVRFDDVEDAVYFKMRWM